MGLCIFAAVMVVVEGFDIFVGNLCYKFDKYPGPYITSAPGIFTPTPIQLYTL